MPVKRYTDAFAPIDPIRAKFLGLLLEGETAVGRRLREGLDAIRAEFSDYADIWWEDLLTLTSESEPGVEVYRGRAGWTRGIKARRTEIGLVEADDPGRIWAVAKNCTQLHDIDGAIAFREAIKTIAAHHNLADDLWSYVHGYIRDGRVWEAPRYDPTQSVEVSLIAIVQRLGETSWQVIWEDGVPFVEVKVPLANATAKWFAVNPIGDRSLITREIAELSGRLKQMLTPYWKPKSRGRDQGVAMYCAYLRYVVGMRPLEIYEMVSSYFGGDGARFS